MQKGGQQHEAIVAAKYGNLQYAEIDKDNKIGMLSHDCCFLCRMLDKGQRKLG